MRLNEGTGTAVTDASGTGNHGTTTSTSWAAMGRFATALSFNGTSSWVTVPDSASLDLTNRLTVEAWVNPVQLTGAWRTVVFKHTNTGMAYALYAANSANRPLGQVHIGGEQNAIGPAALPLNAWSHLATTYDGATVRLFVNGAEVRALAAGGAMAISSGPLKLGGNAIWNEWFAARWTTCGSTTGRSRPPRSRPTWPPR